MASTIKSVASRAVENVGSRSLFLKVNPIPATLSQRRAVLKALQRYGEIEVFKKLANEASFISVAATSDIARKLIDRSPLMFQFIAEPFDGLSPGTTLFTSSQPGVAPPINPIETSSTTSGENAMNKEATRFTVHVFPNESYKHKTVIRYSPLHGPWPKDQKTKETFVYSALKKVVEPNLTAYEGLCDWHTGGQLSDDARTMRNQSQTSKVAHIKERVLRRKLNWQDGRPSTLVELKSLRQPKKDPAPVANEDGKE